MLAASYGSVEDIEILWTFISLVGLLFAAHNLREAGRDKEAVFSADIPNGRAKIAATAVKAETARVIKQSLFLIIGVLAMILPGMDYSGLSFRIVLINILVRWGLILASALTTYQSYLSYRLRKDLL